jgi:hypothetical protein
MVCTVAAFLFQTEQGKRQERNALMGFGYLVLPLLETWKWGLVYEQWTVSSAGLSRRKVGFKLRTMAQIDQNCKVDAAISDTDSKENLSIPGDLSTPVPLSDETVKLISPHFLIISTAVLCL